MNTRILIIADHTDNKLSVVSKELISCALNIEQIIPASIHTVLIGENLDEPTDFFVQKGSDVTPIDLSVLNSEPKSGYLDISCETIKSIVYDENPTIIITGHNSFGLAVLPQLAIHMTASCITGVKKISQKENKLVYTRLIYNGKFESLVCSENKITAISILPGSFNTQYKNKIKPGSKKQIKALGIAKTQIKLKKVSRPPQSDSNFDNADVIVAAGQGIGESDNIEIIKNFSKIFQRSTIAGSRPLIDMGWLPYKYQVGITGKTVSPTIYIACGISGSSQHIAGMGGSEYIVAINSDPNAAIFNVSDICIVSDLLEFIKKVMEISDSP